MSLQIEHKTEKGMLCFVKVNEAMKKLVLDNNYLKCYDNYSLYEVIDIKIIKSSGWRLIGLTSEITEENAKMMVDYGMDYTEFGFANYMWEHGMVYKYPFDNGIESFKYLMQHLQIDSNEKWIVLFKPND